MRAFGLWDILKRRYFSYQLFQAGSWESIKEHGHAYLFIVYPQHYGIATFLAFGMYGSKVQRLANLSPLILMPRFLFYVPIVCDVVQYFGGIMYQQSNIMNALGQRKSVVWSPEGPIPGNQDGDDNSSSSTTMKADTLPLKMFEWLTKHGERCEFSLVPVCHEGEQGLYTNYRFQLPFPLNVIQQYFKRKYDYDIGTVFVGLWGTLLPKPWGNGSGAGFYTKIGNPISTTMIDSLTNVKVKKSATQLRDQFIAAHNSLVVENNVVNGIINV